MRLEIPGLVTSDSTSSTTARDVAALVFRHKRAVVTCFATILTGVVICGLLTTQLYESQMKILLRRGRVDSVVSADRNDKTSELRPDISEEELYSEVELIKSRDVLQKTVIATGLYIPKRHGILVRISPPDNNSPLTDPDNDLRVTAAVKALESALKVELIKKTHIIEISYESPDRALAARVLETLAGLYMEKHLAVHSSPAAHQFFERETGRYQEELRKAESKLQEFNSANGVHDTNVEGQIVLAKMGEFQAALRQATIAITETKRRERELEAQIRSVPTRYTTQVRTNALLLQKWKENLLNLELKRSQMLANYSPTYGPVQELLKEIDQTRAAIRDAESSPLREETTDSDPTHLWLREELVKARADISSLEARRQATETALRQYQQQTAELTKNALIQADLIRQAKMAEEDYVLYQRKQEESLIDGALDQQRILNLSIAQPPFIPTAPAKPRWPWMILTGVMLAFLCSAGLGFGLDYFDSTFRSPDELNRILAIPVLAALPASTETHFAGSN